MYKIRVLADIVARTLSLHALFHHIYGGRCSSPEGMIHAPEHGQLHSPFDVSVDARAVCDAIAAARK